MNEEKFLVVPRATLNGNRRFVTCWTGIPAFLGQQYTPFEAAQLVCICTVWQEILPHGRKAKSLIATDILDNLHSAIMGYQKTFSEDRSFATLGKLLTILNKQNKNGKRQANSTTITI